jgi:uncharacterized protein
MRTVVVIMAKAPVPGQVKTRLSPCLSPRQAAELYALFVQDTLEEMSKVQGQLSEGVSVLCALAVALESGEAKGTFKSILPASMLLLSQDGQDLGERIINIFNRLFAQGFDQVHIIGSDIPDMPHHLVKDSIRLLSVPETDLLLGPCADGGYYLVGLKRQMPELFRGIPWSTDRVLEATLSRADALGLSHSLLRECRDIDTSGDLLQFLQRNIGRGRGRRGPGWRSLAYIRTKMQEEVVR